MSRQQNAEPQHDAKDLWRAHRKSGDSVATFRPGEKLRCPGLLRIPGYYGPCGSEFNGETAKPHTRVVLRVRAYGLSDLPHAGTDLRCHKCGSALEKYTIREARWPHH